MLSTLIVNSYKVLIEISLWLSLSLSIIGGFAVGSHASSMFYGGFLSVVVAVFVWFIFAVVVFGTFLVLEDIRQRVKNIETNNAGMTKEV